MSLAHAPAALTKWLASICSDDFSTAEVTLLPCAGQADNLVRHELRTQCFGLVPKPHQHTVRIQPSVVRRVHGRAQVGDVHRRELLLQFIRFEPVHVAAEPLLGVEVPLEDVAAGGRDDEQVAVLLEADLGRDTVDRHRVRKGLEEIDAVLGQLDIFRQREQPPDPTGCPWGGRKLIGGVTLDDRDPDSWIGGLDVVGDRSTDRTTTDDDNVGSHISCRIARFSLDRR